MGNFITYNISPRKLIDEVLETCSSSPCHLFVQVAHVMLGKACIASSGHLFALNTLFLSLKFSLVKRIAYCLSYTQPRSQAFPEYEVDIYIP